MTELSSRQENDALRHHIRKSRDFTWEYLKASCIVNGLSIYVLMEGLGQHTSEKGRQHNRRRLCTLGLLPHPPAGSCPSPRRLIFPGEPSSGAKPHQSVGQFHRVSDQGHQPRHSRPQCRPSLLCHNQSDLPARWK